MCKTTHVIVVWIWMDEKYKHNVCTSYVQYVACN
jgi:hypothetical protein